jgi:hypothetical protein
MISLVSLVRDDFFFFMYTVFVLFCFDSFYF